MLKNLQHEVCVTVANSRGDKNFTTEVTVLLLKSLWTETTGSLEQVKIEAALQSAAKFSIKYKMLTQKYHQKFSETFCHRVHKFFRGGTNLFFVESFWF